jgi:hypothetical protein
VWPFFHKSFEDYYCGLFISKLGFELARSEESGVSDLKSLEYRLMCHFDSSFATQMDPIRSFFHNTVGFGWKAPLEFATCHAGAVWLLSVYHPQLLACFDLKPTPKSPGSRPSTASKPALIKMASGRLPQLSESDKRFLNSWHGILLFLCALDATESIREEALMILQLIATLPGIDKSFEDGCCDENPLMYAAFGNRGDFCFLISQLQPTISQAA